VALLPVGFPSRRDQEDRNQRKEKRTSDKIPSEADSSDISSDLMQKENDGTGGL
jgi:hypothetical protein